MGDFFAGLLGGLTQGIAEEKLKQEERKRQDQIEERRGYLNYLKELSQRNDLTDQARPLVQQAYQAGASNNWSQVKKLNEALQMLYPAKKQSTYRQVPSTQTRSQMTDESTGKLSKGVANTVAGLPALAQGAPSPQALMGQMDLSAPPQYEQIEETTYKPLEYQSGGMFRSRDDDIEEQLGVLDQTSAFRGREQQGLEDIRGQYRLGQENLRNQGRENTANIRRVIPDPNSPTGFSYGDGTPAPAPRGITPVKATRSKYKLNGEVVEADVFPSTDPSQPSKVMYQGKDISSEATPYLGKDAATSMIGELPKNVADMGLKLRDRFDKATQSFTVIRDNVNRVMLSQDAQGVDDMTLIFAYMKILDAHSVVRESEYAEAARTRSWLEEAEVLKAKVQGGSLKLGPDQRQRFMDRAKSIYEADKHYVTLLEERARKDEKMFGLPENFIVGSGQQFDLASDPNDTTLIKLQTSDGKMWNIPRNKLKDALTRDPGAKEIQ